MGQDFLDIQHCSLKLNKRHTNNVLEMKYSIGLCFFSFPKYKFFYLKNTSSIETEKIVSFINKIHCKKLTRCYF